MRDRPSRTAEAVCLCRALDQLRPPGARILDDPLAELFLSPQGRALIRAARATPRLATRIERRLDPGIVVYVLARHRFIDDALQASLERGVEQVVILGAGYDTRAWRFADALAGRPVFEVDHPATGGRKQRLLARHRDRLGAAPDLRQVAVDFQREALDERLRSAGFTPGRPTFVIWEGVTMYLDPPAIEGTLSVMRRSCGPGSELTADLWHRPAVSGPRSALVRVSAPVFGLIGEPLRFDLRPAEAPAFFARQGWAVVELADAAALSGRYVRDGRKILPMLYMVRLSATTTSSGTGATTSGFGGSGKT